MFFEGLCLCLYILTWRVLNEGVKSVVSYGMNTNQSEKVLCLGDIGILACCRNFAIAWEYLEECNLFLLH